MTTVNRMRIWRTETRASTDVDFWNRSPADDDYMKATYADAGLFLSESFTYSDDQLTRTRTQIWKKVPGIFTAIIQDSNLVDQSGRNLAYNQEHNIQRSQANYEIINDQDHVLVTGTIAE